MTLTLRRKYLALVAAGALGPALLFGAVAIYTALDAAESAAGKTARSSARQVAGRIAQFLQTDRDILLALAETVSPATRLQREQTERVLRNYVIRFPVFKELTLYDPAGAPVATTRAGAARNAAAEAEVLAAALTGRTALSRTFVAADVTPGAALAVPVTVFDKIEGALVASLDLLDLWRLVDTIRVGQTGYALVVDGGGRVVASGQDELKAAAVEEGKVELRGALREALDARTGPGSPDSGLPPDRAAGVLSWYRSASGVDVLGAAVALRDPDWVVAVEQPVVEARAPARQIAVRLALLTFLILIVIALIALGAARPSLRTIEAIAEGTRRVARGEFTHRVSVAAGDELGRLATDFNAMAERLSALTDELRRGERMAAYGRIAAGLAHDLRTPIRNLELGAQLLAEDPTPEGLFSFAERAGTSLRHVNKLLIDLNEVTSLPDPQNELVAVQTDLRKLLAAAAAALEPQAKTARVEVRLELDAETPPVTADPMKLQRAVANLLSNAIDATRDAGGGEVVLRARGAAGRVEIEIDDAGPGIPADRVARLFDEFRTTKRSGHGLGLGLPLVKRIAVLHGGEVRAENRAGKGARFTLTLPLDAAPAPPEAEAQSPSPGSSPAARGQP